jgi:hypothetical protein
MHNVQVLLFLPTNKFIMKRAKILLVVIAVMTIAAGALAFKAKTYGDLFCTRLIDHNAGACEGGYIGKIDVIKGNPYYYTETDNMGGCAETQCESTTFLTDVVKP